jgi:glycogen operon protein
MISGGDEIGRTQLGNNNAYCQDNELSWFPWNLPHAQRDLLAFTRYLIQLRQEQPVLRRRKFFQGRSIRGAEVKEIAWFKPNGEEMDDSDWNAPFAQSLGVYLNGTDGAEMDEKGNPRIGDTLLVTFNAHHRTMRFVLPALQPGTRWERILDTADSAWSRRYVLKPPSYRLRGRSVAVFRRRKADARE